MFTAPSVAGFRVERWSGDEGCSGDAATLTLTDVSTSVRGSAHYVRRLAVSGAIEGSELPLSATSEAPFADCQAAQCEVEAGDCVTLTAPERPGFRFSGFEGEGCHRRVRRQGLSGGPQHRRNLTRK
jgi:hypothetical protein